MTFEIRPHRLLFFVAETISLKIDGNLFHLNVNKAYRSNPEGPRGGTLTEKYADRVRGYSMAGQVDFFGCRRFNNSSM